MRHLSPNTQLRHHLDKRFRQILPPYWFYTTLLCPFPPVCQGGAEQGRNGEVEEAEVAGDGKGMVQGDGVTPAEPASAQTDRAREQCR